MARPVIALLTDFGLSDHYVAAMKGVILGICPDVTLLDITHDIPPQDILSGALELEAVAPYLPDHTIVVGVVDPGVGSTRRAVAIESRAGLRCVGPDNGLFAPVVEAGGIEKAVEISNPAFMRATVSKTFEGRDRFAPAAAWLASGVDLSALGRQIDGLHALGIPAPVQSLEGIDGEVLRVDRFGNLMTNIGEESLEAWTEGVEVFVGDVRIGHLTSTYGDSAPGACCALVGSAGRLEIAVNSGHAANRLGVGRGVHVHVRRLGRA